MSISDFLQPEQIVLDVEARSKKHALEILSQRLAAADETRTAGDFFAAIVQRERLGSTSLGHGVALPHAKLPGVERGVGALMRLTKAVAFDDDDVTLVFGLIGPEDASAENTYNLSYMAALLLDSDLRQKVLAATDAEAVYQALLDAEQPPPRELEESA